MGWLALLALATSWLTAVRAVAFEIVLAGQRQAALSEAVLFPFDPHGVPFRHGLQLALVSTERNAANPVLKPGGPNEPDSESMSNDSTVLQVGEGIRAAWWPRDRLGYFHATRTPIEGQTWVDGVKPHFVSAPIRLPASVRSVSLNASHLSEHARLPVEILDGQFRPLPRHTTAGCEPFRDDSSFRLPVRWRSGYPGAALKFQSPAIQLRRSQRVITLQAENGATHSATGQSLESGIGDEGRGGQDPFSAFRSEQRGAA